jgi:hypothetical protein
MRASRITRAVSWRHAFGEIVLIVVGIFIGLQASEWWGRMAERRTEVAYLAELRMELSIDRERISSGLDRYRKIERKVEELLTILRSDQPYSEAVDPYFGAVYGVNAFALGDAAYESLKSYGLVLISNRELRAQIAHVYEDTYPGTRRSISYEEGLVLDLLRPYFLVNFRDLRFDASATPLDYDAISKSPEFINLVDYRLQLTRQNQIPVFERALGKIDSLIASIDTELM